MDTGRRVMVIGLDGGSWSVLDTMMGAGCMPTLEGLVRGGYRTTLLSAVPPVTPVAWASFATGMNPGRHGIFGFLSPRDEPGSYSPPPVSRLSLRGPTLWRRLSDLGLATTVLSVPLSYPPEPVNGFLISGMFTPGPDSECTYPASLRDELAAEGNLPKFQLDLALRQRRGRAEAELERALSGGAEEFFRDLDGATESLLRAARRLVREPWDLFVAVLIGTDRLQHVLWPEVAAFEESPDLPISKRIGAFYRKIDDGILEMAESAGADAYVLIVSDHGFGACGGQFAMARWLVDAGYSRYRPRGAYSVARGLLGALGVKHVAARMLRGGALSKAVRREFVPLDWSGSRAYFVPGTHGIRVNLRGRERQGIVEPGAEYEDLRREIADRVLAIRDPSSGESVFAAVEFAEDVYDGPETVWAPDLVLEPNAVRGYAPVAGDPRDRRLVLPTSKSRGSHRREGILLASGPGVPAAVGARPARICDIAPTVMRLLGIQPAEEMDGRLLDEAFERLPGLRAGASGRSRAGGDRREGGVPEAEPYSDEEETELRRRLRNLGYVD